MEKNILKKDVLKCPYCLSKIKKVRQATIKKIKTNIINFKISIDDRKQKLYL